MKKLYLTLCFLVSASLFAQDYDKNWNKVIELENTGKIKSASAEVEKIYRKAADKKEEVQLIKCFFYQSKYMQKLEENAQSKILENLHARIGMVSAPSKAILNLVYAKCLAQYLNVNGYKLRSRTATDSMHRKDFLTWTTEDLVTEINASYEKSLEPEAVLVKIPLRQYEPLFDFMSVEKFDKLSLYDYLLNESIYYYSSKINRWEIMPFQFAQHEKAFYGGPEEFVATNLDSVHNSYLQKTLLLYQKREMRSPVLDNQFDRLQFCNEFILKSPDQFLTALASLQKKATDTILRQKIMFEKANVYFSQASKETHPDYNVKAVALLDSILKFNNRSNTLKLATVKKENITSKKLIVRLLKNIYPNENHRIWANYCNVENISVSCYKISTDESKRLSEHANIKDSIVQLVRKRNPAKFFETKLPNKNDHFMYSTEVVMPGLDVGHYLLYFESDGYWIDGKAASCQTISVSSLSVLAHNKGASQYYQVLDRKTGKPIENVAIQSATFTIKTNKDGIAKYLDNYKERDINVMLSKDNDTLCLYKNYVSEYQDYREDDEEFKAKIEFYLDRAIYRPGQTVYFKGIAIRKKGDKSVVAPKVPFHIIVENSDYDEFKSFDLTTNEFGSFSGEFELPKSTLTGDFRIRAEEPADVEKDPLYDVKKDEHPFWDYADYDDSQIEFKVEEYKRPKFEVTFTPVGQTLAIGQEITISGNAKAFAGSNLSNATVHYTISPTTYENYFDYRGDDEDAIVGEAKTDVAGKFSIIFTATPFAYLEKKKLPVISYLIKADVIDINGEAHSAETVVKAGYHALELGVQTGQTINPDVKNKAWLNSTNLNGQFKPVNGSLKLYLIREADNKFKPRPWPSPEIENISKTDFGRLFPYEKPAAEKSTSNTETLVWSGKADTGKTKEIPLDFLSNAKPGQYKLVFSATDEMNNTIEKNAFFELAFSKKKIDPNYLFTVSQLNDDPKKDGYAELKILSVIPEIYIQMTAGRSRDVFLEKTIRVTNHEAIVKIPFKEEFSTGFSVGFNAVFENAAFNDTYEVQFMEDVQNTTFETESFRSKIEPGSTENWSFKLSPKGLFGQAEVLASMYDSSLDQFAKEDWQGLKFWNYHNNYNFDYKSPLGFGSAETYFLGLNPPSAPIELRPENVNLIWFGFDFNNIDSYSKDKEYKKQVTRKAKKPANAKLISGTVSDATGTLPGANVTVKGTIRTVNCDVDGYYEIEAAPGEELVFSFIGVKEKSITLGQDKKLDVTLTSDGVQLEGVVVTAYGFRSNQKKSLAYATTTIEDNSIYGGSFIETLQGQVAGLTVNGVPGAGRQVILRGNSSIIGNSKNVLVVIDGAVSTVANLEGLYSADVVSATVLKDASATALYGSRGANGVLVITTKKAMQELVQVKARSNLSETAFFFPHLETDSKGMVRFSFTSPESLTLWKLRLLAHNKDAVTAYFEKNVVAQKEIMVMPNLPRFLREKDTITVVAKISNITSEAKTGIAMLQLFDAVDMSPIDAQTGNSDGIRNFTIPPMSNTSVSWKIVIPEGLQGVQYKVLAKSGDFSDGEENILPVLTNNILVTETIPIWVRENSKKEYVFDNLKNNTSATLRNHQLVLEYTSNPTWTAIQSLPYLMEYEHECAEQTFARLYANVIATDIINSNPKIASIFDNWRKDGKPVSKLAQNETLKSIILAETPWLNDAGNEDEKKKNLALLFDLEKMKSTQAETFEKLKQKQQSSGVFVWFEGGAENEYITRHILSGLGHLKKLNVKSFTPTNINSIAKTGIPYIDGKFMERHKSQIQNKKATWFQPYNDLHYWYTRSFYLDDHPLPENIKVASKMYLEQIKNHWLEYSLYEKGMAALVLSRFGEAASAKKILTSLKETASNNDDWGMYWIENKDGWYWHQAPIETQALLIEAFVEIGNDKKSADAMKVWLLKKKQNKNWPTTKSTTEAIYALMMQGSDWLSVKDNTVIKIGNSAIETKKLSESDKEAGTGYLKVNWTGDEIKKEMAVVSVENNSKVPGFGGCYWQYFEDIDKIKSNSKGMLSVSKKLYLKKNTEKGAALQEISVAKPLEIGNLVTVRLTIVVKESMEYIHLKDMRAACFEPVDVISGYEWEGGLGFYKSTKDVATHYFFDNMKAGTYLLEYDLRVNNAGDFSNGITTIESMYAPEFTSHTKGIRVQVK